MKNYLKNKILRTIADDIEFGYDAKMILNKIKSDSYSGIAPEADRNAVLGEGWRDVTKELPDITDQYLIYDKNYGYVIAIYCKGLWDDDNREYTQVIGWIPLPVPPSFA